MKGTLRLEDGRQATFDHELFSGAFTVAGASGLDGQVTRAVSAALGAEVIHGDVDLNWFMRVPLADRHSPELGETPGAPGRYTAEVGLVAYRIELGAVISPEPGARASSGSAAFSILNRTQNADAIMLRVRLAKPALLWARARELEFQLVDRARGEALPGRLVGRRSRLSQFSLLYLSSPVSELGFDKTPYDRQLPADWFQQATLALLTVREEGAFTVQVAADSATIK